MLLTLKGADNSTVIIQTDNMLFIGNAMDAGTKQPLMGYSTVMYTPTFGVVVRGTAAEIAEMIKLREV